MREIIGKLRSAKGETLIESVASILVFTFSSIILLTMISASAKLNAQTDRADEQLRTELRAAESQSMGIDNEHSEGSISVTLDGVSYAPTQITVYSSGENTLWSFEVKR